MTSSSSSLVKDLLCREEPDQLQPYVAVAYQCLSLCEGSFSKDLIWQKDPLWKFEKYWFMHSRFCARRPCGTDPYPGKTIANILPLECLLFSGHWFHQESPPCAGCWLPIQQNWMRKKINIKYIIVWKNFIRQNNNFIDEITYMKGERECYKCLLQFYIEKILKISVNFNFCQPIYLDA